MIIEDARKVAAICTTADSGCFYCADQLRLKLVEAFPEFEWTMNDDGEVEVKEKEKQP